MSTYRITVINQTFRVCNDHELPSFDAARKLGLQAALSIGIEEVVNRVPFFGAELRIENGDETLGRFLVSIGASSLQPE